MKVIHIVLLGSIVCLSGCSGKMPTLGLTEGQFLPCPDKPNCVSSQATDQAHYIEPIVVKGEQSEIQQKLIDILASMDEAEIKVIDKGYIRSEFTSSIFRFVDDIEFNLTEVYEKSVLIHVRSASRVGYSDLGVNRSRVEAIRSKFSQLTEK